MHTDDFLLDKLKELSTKLGRAPYITELAKMNAPCWNTYVRRFGSYSDAVRKIGFEPRLRGGAYLRSLRPPRLVTGGLTKEDKERALIIGKKVFLYPPKVPFLKSGFSKRGALEYDPEDDTVRCHDCGKWFHGLGHHTRFCSGLDARGYKVSHGLQQKSALIGEKVREKLIITGQNFIQHLLNKNYLRKDNQGPKNVSYRTTEYLNNRELCPPQAILKLKNLAKQLGRTPTISEMREAKIPPGNLIMSFGSVRKALAVARLTPINGGRPKYDKPRFDAVISNFYKTHHRPPSKSDIRRGLVPSPKIAVRLYGSWNAALAANGIPVYGKEGISRDHLLEMLRVCVSKLGRAPTPDEHKLFKLPKRQTYVRRFGTWKAALGFVNCKPLRERQLKQLDQGNERITG